MGEGVIGKGITIRGELDSEEDLIIEGRVEGHISLNRHLIVEETGIVLADIQTENITVKGELQGDMMATQMVAINETAKVIGDVKAPRLFIADGARFKGKIEMDVPLPADL